MLRFCALSIVLACAAPALQSPHLAAGSKIEKPIASGEIHHYQITLETGEVFVGAIDQLGADVTITVIGPDGVVVGKFDTPTGTKSTENVRIDAKQAGTYRIEVTLAVGQGGSYRARVIEIVRAAELEARLAKERADVDAFFDSQRDLVDAFVGWARNSAIGADFTEIDALIGKARVISLGEADHNVHEYLAFRNRLARYLVENRGVTAILVESGFDEATAVDDYVTGASNVSSRDVAAAMFMWDPPPAMQDNVELIEWLRAYNAKATRKVHVYGIDVTGGENGLYVHSRRAIDAALAFLATHDREAYQRLEPRFRPVLAKFSTAGYLELDAARRAELTSSIGELLATFKSAPASAEARRARQSAAMAAVVETFFRQTVDRSSPNDLADVSLDGIRDATMGANVMWALAEQGADSRVFLFTHNAHARRCDVTAWPAKIKMNASMGQYLANSLRDQLVVIGFLHGDGPPTATLDGLFARVGLPGFVVDLRSAPEPVRVGLSRPWKLRLDGMRAYGLEPIWSVVPAKCFDALAFTSTSSEAALASRCSVRSAIVPKILSSFGASGEPSVTSLPVCTTLEIGASELFSS